MSEQKPVANAFRDIDTGEIKYIISSTLEDEDILLAQYEDVCIITPDELSDQLKAEREKTIRETLLQCSSISSQWYGTITEHGVFISNEINRLLSTDESKEWNEKRQDVVGQNGNDGLHYEEVK